MFIKTVIPVSIVLTLAIVLRSSALGGEAVMSPSPTATPEPRFKISGWIDAGITTNPSSPDDNQNFGRFFDDRSNEPVVNQITLNLERTLAPQPGQLDWGFKLHLMFGTDTRFIHSLGLLDHSMSTSLYQPDIS